jgi:hypothetical protein
MGFSPARQDEADHWAQPISIAKASPAAPSFDRYVGFIAVDLSGGANNGASLARHRRTA